MMMLRFRSAIFLMFVAVSPFVLANDALAVTRLKNVCRVKGQEENTLQGLGLVIGLKGTGDGGKFLPTIRSLATAMQFMGSPIGPGGAVELKDANNVALVMVTATVPAAGARQGDKIDCRVSSIGAAKSLVGGRLFMTPLRGPQVGNPRVFGFAEGAIHLDDPKMPTNGRVHEGARLEEDFFNVFTKNDKVTLVMNEHYADFEVVQEIVDSINSQLAVESTSSPPACAIDPQNIQVTIPPQYHSEPVQFIAQLTGLQISEPRTDARVVINERAGSVIIGADVEIGPVVITHKNMVIEAGTGVPDEKFVALHPDKQPPTKLRDLVASLNTLKVPNEDVIEIIKGLEKNGKLFGRLIVE